MSIENTVLLDQYYESKVNLQNNSYVPNVGEYWYKYKKKFDKCYYDFK